MKLETNQIRLRPFVRADRDVTLGWRNTPQVRDAAMGYRYPVNDVMEDRWFDRVLDGNDKSKVYFAIETVAETDLIGFSSLTDIDYVSSHAQFGIMLGDTSHHNKGFGTDTLNLTLGYAFQSLNLRRIYLFVRSGNEAAVKLFKKAGFEEEGVLKKHFFVDGEYDDVLVMALFKSQFELR